MPKGNLMLVLHGHLPYVHHPEARDHLEERWFFEAMTECYLPLLKVMEGWVRDGVDFRLCFSLSPTLISMLWQENLREKYCRYLEKLIELADKEVVRTKGQPSFNSLASMYSESYGEIYRYYKEEKQTDLITAFRKLKEDGSLVLFTCCATHAYLPLVKTRESVRAQVAVGVELFAQHFGEKPEGLWLPECGYRAGVEKYLAEFGIKYFFLDSHGILYASPQPKYGVYAPVSVGQGVFAFGRDPESSRQVWSMREGYPGDYRYREYYRDIGFDLDLDYLNAYLPANIRRNLGIKYYRITGKEGYKEPYNPQMAREAAVEHAENFLLNRQQQIQKLSLEMDRAPVVVAPYDAELLGHWWYEGPQWLDCLVRKIHYDQDQVQLTDPLTCLKEEPPEPFDVALQLSSWGHEGYSSVWLNGKNDWVYRHLHKAEERMIRLAEHNTNAFSPYSDALNQAARELLLAQASDWTFIISMDTAVQYAKTRISEHLEKFNRLYDMIEEKRIDTQWLKEVHGEDPLFPQIDYQMFFSREQGEKQESLNLMKKSSRPRILMLSWEFPPYTVGGLARHVDDLSHAMAEQGMNVHIVTFGEGFRKKYENREGVHVHRLDTFQFQGNSNFNDWIFQLNLIIFEYARRLYEDLGGFDLVHAHDWLVAYAATSVKKHFQIPLLATIHATEFGRNRGIHTLEQRYVHEVEWWLSHEARRVICCSDYMQQELENIFYLPRDKIRVIPNGVDPANLKPEPFPVEWRLNYAGPQEKMVLFMGRLVIEKGVDNLVEAIPEIVREYPAVKFVIAGRGPYGEELQKKVKKLGVEDRVVFPGFVKDRQRNRLYACADVAVFPSRYEPFGIVAIEALAARVPVVVGDTGGLAEIVADGVEGLTFPPGDSSSLAFCILKLLTQVDLCRRLCDQGWQKVISLYNWGIIAGQTHEVYQEILREQVRIPETRAQFE
ncbi:1,4-alpha-glucan branching protein domain-containing protein [Candidatus Contubernalis alkaliaceticus]|uniref:1,4-alpha-glucan branching protein domain-containing protein n=1 Tax=Candidatus Contubernalis alkaliaceticus TaxID=338645 RepID=UPI001F4C48DF|nr:1,4-alpha-glucan branching protein domain-containing protein [Candidatus Contubernalis alkalaceticus]UNC93425.1 DUF1957 domain-containing protein [Candidatus Contubernalis alkalaceticus]